MIAQEGNNIAGKSMGAFVDAVSSTVGALKAPIPCEGFCDGFELSYSPLAHSVPAGIAADGT